MNILVLDIGTTSMRGILYDQDGNELCQVSRLTPLIFIVTLRKLKGGGDQ